MKTLSLELSQALEARLATAARHRGASKSVIVRGALEAYRSQNNELTPTTFAALAKGVIGCVDGGPPDLSYSSRHMKGFGR